MVELNKLSIFPSNNSLLKLPGGRKLRTKFENRAEISWEVWTDVSLILHASREEIRKKNTCIMIWLFTFLIALSTS